MTGRNPDGEARRLWNEGWTDEQQVEVKSGPGGLCAEAQADGVPCTESGRDCRVCSRAIHSNRRERDVSTGG